MSKKQSRRRKHLYFIFACIIIIPILMCGCSHLYALTPAARARLDQDVVGKLATCASIEAVVVEGHADRIGSQQYNQKLSERRADSVKAYLVSKGTDRDKIETIGMGKTVPAKFCPDIKNRKELIACLAPNRRAIISLKGVAR